MDTFEKLRILAESAKYDVSCASSGVERKNTATLGNSRKFGICHAWAADGRCISLLKVLLTNNCIYDCIYCVNNCRQNTERASFSAEELSKLTYEFYRRNYIEGLFLSSGVEKNPNYTMEKIYQTLYLLRTQYGFSGYIHAKLIPNADPEYYVKIGFLADRVSINMELPSAKSLALLAPHKTVDSLLAPMNTVMTSKSTLPYQRSKLGKSFVPGGQSTQLIVGASPDSDRKILFCSEHLYQTFHLKRVYYSAYIPMVEHSLLPAVYSAPPKLREHRLYQADWLLRYYGFTASEILTDEQPNFELSIDPKLNWALSNYEKFPIDVHKADYSTLLRVPGIGPTSAKRILESRRFETLDYDKLKKMGITLKRAKYFLLSKGKPLYKLPSNPLEIRLKLNDSVPTSQISLWECDFLV